MAKNIYEMQKKQITAGTCINNAKFQGTAALPHAALSGGPEFRALQLNRKLKAFFRIVYTLSLIHI